MYQNIRIRTLSPRNEERANMSPFRGAKAERSKGRGLLVWPGIQGPVFQLQSPFPDLSPIACLSACSVPATLFHSLSLKHEFSALTFLAFPRLFLLPEMHFFLPAVGLKSLNHPRAGAHSVFHVKSSLFPEINAPQSPSSLPPWTLSFQYYST